MAKQSARDCQEFDVGPFVEFTGAVDFSTFTPVNLATSTAADRIKECKAKCINDDKCGIWSVAGNKCNMYTVDGSARLKNGLVVNPNYMYNSGLPNSTYSTIMETNTEACKTRCKNDRKCNFFEYTTHDGSKRCKLNTVSSSPRPTGFVKTWICSGFECAKGRTYWNYNTQAQITFHATNNTLTLYRAGPCSIPITYTLSTDKSRITFTIPTDNAACTLTDYTGGTMQFTEGTFPVRTMEFASAPVFQCSPATPPLLTIPTYSPTCMNIFNCVKGKEFFGPVNSFFGSSICIKFDTKFGTLFMVVCHIRPPTYVTSCDQCILIENYIVDDNVIKFTWTYDNTQIYRIGLYNYIDGDPWSLSITIEHTYSTGSAPTVLTGGPTQASRIVRGACSAAVTCPADSFVTCPPSGGGAPDYNNICSGDKSIAICKSMCTETDILCPNTLFTTTTKFINFNVYSDKLIFTRDPDNHMIVGDIACKYFVKRTSDPDKFIILNGLEPFEYTRKTIGTVLYQRLKSLRTYNKYIELSVYFFKRTIIAPVYGSVKTVNIPEERDSYRTYPAETIQDPILYHCYMFDSLTTGYYTVVKKSNFATIHNANYNDTGENSDMEIDPISVMGYEHIIDAGIDNIPCTYSINTYNETMNIPTHSRPTVVFEEHDYIERSKLYDVDGVDNGINISFEIDPSAFSQSGQLISQSWENYTLKTVNISGINWGAYTHIKLFNPTKTPDTYYARIGAVNIYNSGGYLYNKVVITIVNSTNYVNPVLVLGNYMDRITAYNNFCSGPYVRMSFGTFRSIDNLTITDEPILSNCVIGSYYIYNSQFLSGIGGYNISSSHIHPAYSGISGSSYDGISGSWNNYTNIEEVIEKCNMTENAIGFEWQNDSFMVGSTYMYRARLIMFGDQNTAVTSASEIIKSHVENGTQRYHTNCVDIRIQSDGRNVPNSAYNSRGDVTVEQIYSYNTLVHNIFPADAVSPISDDSLLPSTPSLQYNGAWGLKHFSSLGKNPYMVPGDATNPKIAYNNSYRYNSSNRVYIRSNQPNLGRRFFRGVPLLHMLPYRYTARSGELKSIPVTITVNSIKIKNVNYTNIQLFLYRMEDTNSTNTETYFITTVDGGIIDKNGGKNHTAYADCLWYIENFSTARHKIFLVSTVDTNIVLELVLTSGTFSYPPPLSRYSPTTIEFNVVDFTCKMNIYDKPETTYKYQHIGNHIMVYKNTITGNEVIKTFIFTWDGTLYDTDTGFIMDDIPYTNQDRPMNDYTLVGHCDPVRIRLTTYNNNCNINQAKEDYCNGRPAGVRMIPKSCNICDPDSGYTFVGACGEESDPQCGDVVYDDSSNPVYNPIPGDQNICTYIRGSTQNNNYHRGSFIMIKTTFTYSIKPKTQLQEFVDLISNPATLFATLLLPPVLYGDLDPLSNALFFAFLIFPFKIPKFKFPFRLPRRKIPDTPIDLADDIEFPPPSEEPRPHPGTGQDGAPSNIEGAQMKKPKPDSKPDDAGANPDADSAIGAANGNPENIPSGDGSTRTGSNIFIPDPTNADPSVAIKDNVKRVSNTPPQPASTPPATPATPTPLDATTSINSKLNRAPEKLLSTSDSYPRRPNEWNWIYGSDVTR